MEILAVAPMLALVLVPMLALVEILAATTPQEVTPTPTLAMAMVMARIPTLATAAIAWA